MEIGSCDGLWVRLRLEMGMSERRSRGDPKQGRQLLLLGEQLNDVRCRGERSLGERRRSQR